MRLLREDGSVVCEDCALATSPWARMRGLLGRDGLGEREGILLRPASSIHTWFMRFPIDVVYVDAELRVLKVVESLPPWRMSAQRSARSVIELAAGSCTRAGLAVGARLAIE